MARKAERTGKLHQMDMFLMGLAVFLTGLGLLLIYDASYYSAFKKFGDGLYFVKSQSLGAALGLVAMIFLSRVDYHIFKNTKILLLLMAISVGLLVAVLAVGEEIQGAKRWLNLGISIQPSEIAKFAMVCFLAWFMTKNRPRIRQFRIAFITPFAVFGIYALLIMAQPNLSTTIVIGAVTLTMIAVSGANLGHWMGISAAAVTGVIGFIFSAEYRTRRLLAFINPWGSMEDEGFQLVQSLYAIGAGGLFGVGFGHSIQKFNYLPFAESDFIFAIVAEEFGLVGACVLLALFALLIWRGIRIALTSPDHYGMLLAIGITAMIAFQVLINVAVVTGSMPPTGLPLPFISAGGSSLTILLGEIGVLLSISRRIHTT